MVSISEDEKQEIEDYLSLDEDLLYSLLSPFSGGVQYSPKGQIEAGKKVFDELKPSLYEKVCVDWDCCKKIDNPGLQDDINLVASIADILAAITFGLPPFVIATLLVKIGLRRFCKCG